MEYLSFILLSLAGLLILLLLLSLLDAAISHLTQVQLKVLAEQERFRKESMLKKLAEDRLQVQLHLRVGSQLIIVIVAVLTTYLSLQHFSRFPLLWAFLSTGGTLLLVRQVLPHWIVIRHSQRFLLALLPVLKTFYLLLGPFLWPVFSSWRRAASKEKEEEAAAGTEEEATEEEIQAFLDVGEEEGILEEHDSEMIQSVVEFGNTLVREVMTPRLEIVALAESGTFRQARDLMLENKHSRIPLYRESIDNIVGMVNIRQALAFSQGEDNQRCVKDYAKPLPFVPETKKVRELLKELQAWKIPMAIVIDEFGGVAGLVTVADLLKEIVGEIRDEDDTHPEDIQPLEDGSFRVSGETPLDRFEETLQMESGKENCITVSGLMILHLGRLPKTGDRFPYQGYQVEILESDGRRILSMVFRKPGPGPAPIP